MSPILVVYLVTLALAGPYESNSGIAFQESGYIRNNSSKKIIVLLFDEWSYHLTFENGEVSDRFPNLKRFAKRSINFHRVYASGHWTFSSIPNILSGQPGNSSVKDHDHVLTNKEESVLVRNTDHIFRRMKRMGFRTSICGSYMPYPELFADSVDSCESRSIYKIMGDRISGVVGSFIAENVSIRWGRFVPLLRRPYRWLKHRFYVDLHSWAEEWALSEIEREEPLFTFVHLELPHMPFIYGRNGVSRELWKKDDSTSNEQYLQNMDHADVVMGRLIDAVSNSSFAKDTMLVLMSDHNFRYYYPSKTDVSRPTELCHIPLLIHVPGQKERLDVDTLFPAYSLPDLVTAYAGKTMSAPDVVEWCNTNLPDFVIAYSLNGRIEIR